MPLVRFAPSPTGFLHIGSVRTFIFNCLYTRRNGATMQSTFHGLNWLDRNWDEKYRQSDREEGERPRSARDAAAKLDRPGTREALRKFADKLLAGELGVRPGVGPSAYHLFIAIGRDRAIGRLRSV